MALHTNADGLVDGFSLESSSSKLVHSFKSLNHDKQKCVTEYRIHIRLRSTTYKLSHMDTEATPALELRRIMSLKP